jgi:drug/metabolite transporter (DMT)-like permease
MTSILCGLAAACCWATANVLGTRVARGGADPREFAFYFHVLECALCAPVGLVLLSSAHISADDVFWLAVVGASTAATSRLLNLAFRHGRLGVIGPLMSLEGVVAIALAIVATGHSSAVVLWGIAISTVGCLAVAFAAQQRGHLAGSSYALPAAVFSGVALWALAHQPLNPLLATMIARGIGAAMLAPGVPKWRVPPVLAWMAAVAALDATANTLFLIGSRAGSLAATAVLAAQFGTFTALGGVWHWKESLTIPQVVALLILGAGVAAIALSS